ncbi:MAG: hypothetical protein WBB01_06640 [Phormidesmis sp.]
MNRLVLSTLTVLLAAGAAAPMAQAFDAKLDPDFSLQELRMRELDARNKSADSEPFNLHKLRLEEAARRNKDSLKTTSLIGQRHQVLDRTSSK